MAAQTGYALFGMAPLYKMGILNFTILIMFARVVMARFWLQRLV